MRNPTLEEKLVIYKIKAISKIVSQSYITKVAKHIVNKLVNKRYFCWNKSTPNIKHDALYNDYKDGGLKNVDIPNKFQLVNAHGYDDFMIIPFMNVS